MNELEEFEQFYREIHPDHKSAPRALIGSLIYASSSQTLYNPDTLAAAGPEMRHVVPPRSGTTTLLATWIAWCLGKYPDSRFLYITRAAVLGDAFIAQLRTIMQSHAYSQTFFKDCEWLGLRDPSQEGVDRQRHLLATRAGGVVLARGIGGALTGYGAGMRGASDRFSGAIIVDDPYDHRMSREETGAYLTQTIATRRCNRNVPTIMVVSRSSIYDLGEEAI